MPLRETIPEGNAILGVSFWKKQVMELAQRVNGALTNLIANDFETDSAAAEYTIGVGSVSYDVGLSGGVARIRTTPGLPLPGGGVVYNAGGAAIIGSPAGESWYAHAACSIQDAPAANTTFRCIGIQDSLAGTADFVTFGLVGPIDATYLSLEASINGVGTTVEISRVAGDIGVFHHYAMAYDADSNTLYAIYDGAVIIEIPSPTTITANPCFMFSGVNNGIGPQDAEIWVDNIAAVVEPVS